MAGDARRQATEGAEVQLIVFTLGREYYGVDIGAISTIIRPPAITFVPHTPAHVMGVMNLRGVIIPVVDLRLRLGFEHIDQTASTRVVVVELDKIQVGMMVDAVTETLSIPKASIEPLPAMVLSVDSNYLRGVAKAGERLIILLELGKVLEAGDVEQLGAIVQERSADRA